MVSTNLELISTPTVFNPESAKDNAVGRPILPIPIIHIERLQIVLILLTHSHLIA